MSDGQYLEKLTRIFEESLNVTRTIDVDHPATCDLCGKQVTHWIKANGRTLGLTCDCPETIFLLLIAFDKKRVKRVAIKLGMTLEIKNVRVKQIELGSQT